MGSFIADICGWHWRLCFLLQTETTENHCWLVGIFVQRLIIQSVWRWIKVRSIACGGYISGLYGNWRVESNLVLMTNLTYMVARLVMKD